MPAPVTKRCACCDKPFPLSEFGKNRQSKDGLHYYSKLCAALKSKAWYEANTAKAKASAKRWKQNTMRRHLDGEKAAA